MKNAIVGVSQVCVSQKNMHAFLPLINTFFLSFSLSFFSHYFLSFSLSFFLSFFLLFLSFLLILRIFFVYFFPFTQSESAVVVVSAAAEERDAGLAADGAAREQLLVTRALGVQNFIVVINKMDAVEDGQAREVFEAAKAAVLAVLQEIGVEDAGAVPVLPVSALEGVNVADLSKKVRFEVEQNKQAKKKSHEKQMKQNKDKTK